GVRHGKPSRAGRFREIRRERGRTFAGSVRVGGGRVRLQGPRRELHKYREGGSYAAGSLLRRHPSSGRFRQPSDLCRDLLVVPGDTRRFLQHAELHRRGDRGCGQCHCGLHRQHNLHPDTRGGVPLYRGRHLPPPGVALRQARQRRIRGDLQGGLLRLRHLRGQLDHLPLQPDTVDRSRNRWVVGAPDRGVRRGHTGAGYQGSPLDDHRTRRRRGARADRGDHPDRPAHRRRCPVGDLRSPTGL
ncbi:MAG: hypothetical protein AVDCRST_MAG22-177, partial [uncultured Rubrobacteraceae bacterium]